jgi:hypothetical protein
MRTGKYIYDGNFPGFHRRVRRFHFGREIAGKQLICPAWVIRRRAERATGNLLAVAFYSLGNGAGSRAGGLAIALTGHLWTRMCGAELAPGMPIESGDQNTLLEAICQDGQADRARAGDLLKHWDS